MRTPPPPGKRLAHDWIGLRVRTPRAISNGYMSAPPGAEWTVVNVSPGLQLRADPCPHCNIRAQVSRIDSRDVQIVKAKS